MRSLAAWFTPRRRRYVYRVTTAALVLAAGYGIVTDEEAQRWATFLGIALVTGMADANVPTGRHAASSVDE